MVKNQKTDNNVRVWSSVTDVFEWLHPCNQLCIQTILRNTQYTTCLQTTCSKQNTRSKISEILIIFKNSKNRKSRDCSTRTSSCIFAVFHRVSFTCCKFIHVNPLLSFVLPVLVQWLKSKTDWSTTVDVWSFVENGFLLTIDLHNLSLTSRMIYMYVPVVITTWIHYTLLNLTNMAKIDHLVCVETLSSSYF